MLRRERLLRRRITARPRAPATVRAFQQFVLEFYNAHRRPLPWRRTRNPYHVVVSEIMLQQTHVPRVMQKYGEFIAAFPDWAALARAPLREVLRVWRGMGYNRRALALQRIAQCVVGEHRGRLPGTPDALQRLPGIGKATAASIAAFAFNQPTVFVETNIRTVFIHYFFARRRVVRDTELLPLIAATRDCGNPCRWYNALMDVGTWLKARGFSKNSASAAHRPQPRFAGSTRELRGKLIATLTSGPAQTAAQLARQLEAKPTRVSACLQQLCAEGLLRCRAGRYAPA
jgi:A/G-specific adenine glycosylase